MKFTYKYKISYLSATCTDDRPCAYELECDKDQPSIEMECRSKFGERFVSATMLDTWQEKPARKPWWKQITKAVNSFKAVYAAKKLKEATDSIADLIAIGCQINHENVNIIQKISDTVMTDIGEHPEVYAQPIIRLSNSIKRIITEIKLVTAEVKQSLEQNKEHFSELSDACKEAISEHDYLLETITKKGEVEVEKLENLFK